MSKAYESIRAGLSEAIADAATFAHYSICFIDLLGQREAMRGQQLLPLDEASAEFKQFIQSARDSIGKIIDLQEDANRIVRAATERRSRLDISSLPRQKRRTFKQAGTIKIKQQRWSDGLVLFSRHVDSEVKCPMNAAFILLSMAGSLCLLGLASKAPLRGAIDFAWGVELRPNELYGPVVARAYELESEVAQYPRIVVGAEFVRYLEAHRDKPESDDFSEIDRALALRCLSMLAIDADGHSIVHYLGEPFIESVTHQQHEALYLKAREFVVEESGRIRKIGNPKLALRYSHLYSYFDAYPPPSVEGEAQ